MISKNKIYQASLFLLILAGPLPSKAQDQTGFFDLIRKLSSGDPETSPYAIFDFFLKIVTSLQNLLIIYAPVVAALFVAYSGAKYIYSAGNPEKQKKALASLNAALIGLALVLLASSFFYFIINYIGYQIPEERPVLR